MRLRRPIPALLLLAALAACTSSSEPAEVTTVTLSSANLSLDALGATSPLTATVRDQRSKTMNGVTLAWSSSAPGVATVSNAGVVTAVANGTATISATADGITAQATVTVLQLPVAPAIVSGNLQQATVGTALALPLEVRVVDRLGNAMAGRQVTFAVTSGGGSLSSAGGTSGANGLVSTTWTLGTSTTTLQQVTAAVQGVVAGTTLSATALAGPAVAMAVAPGNTADGQIGIINQAVSVRPAVVLTDVHGNGVGGVTVTFAATAGGGSVTGGSVVTASSGVATVGAWTMGSSAGVNTLTASAGALTPVIFTANAVTDPCQPAGATPLTVGVSRNSTISSTDCPGPNGIEFEWYRFDLAASTAVIIEMTSTQLDAYVQLYDFGTQTLIEENDDIQTGVITDSRISRTLAAGSYLLRARTWDSTSAGAYSIVVRTAALGVPTSAVIVAGEAQTAPPGVAPVAPRIRVLDEGGQGVPNVTVTFATVPGIGSVTGGSTTTDASGFAQVGSWTLATGANVLTATVSGLASPVIFSGTGKNSTSGFDISLRFATVPTANQLQTFSDAAARWESIITADLVGVPLNQAAGTCNSATAINETIDDVVIVVRLEPIDGAGAVLGSAGPCFVRSSTTTPASQAFIPILGSMRFDTADLANLEAAGSFGAVILHEMGHVLGIGTIWSSKGLLQLPSPTTGTGNDTHFSGTAAIAAFNTVGGSTYTGGNKVPVENNQGGAGTRNSHWRESVLQNELMTGFLNSGSANPLSVLTIASLQDLGYTVNTAAADAFFVVTTLRAEGSEERTFEMKGDIRSGPVYEVERDGRVKGMPAPAPVRRTKKPRR
ncbi:MAG: Ig-like domain-containing protein [Gemmatimonadaceae bacterium]|nr:Ig-like domain-containing protein [Gemmatimonadaceae bacterium]